MGAFSQEQIQHLPYSSGSVFHALVELLPKLGYKILDQNASIGRIASRGPKQLVWRHSRLTIVIEAMDSENSKIRIWMSMASGSGARGGWGDWAMQGYHEEIDRIVFELARSLAE